MLEAEIKHARLAMLAAAGWVGSELAGGRLLALAASPLLRYGDRVPSVLNGGLGHSLEPFFTAFAGVVALAGVVEAFQVYGRRADPEGYAARSVYDLGFDPLRLGSAGDGGRRIEARAPRDVGDHRVRVAGGLYGSGRGDAGAVVAASPQRRVFGGGGIRIERAGDSVGRAIG